MRLEALAKMVDQQDAIAMMKIANKAVEHVFAGVGRPIADKGGEPVNAEAMRGLHRNMTAAYSLKQWETMFLYAMKIVNGLEA